MCAFVIEMGQPEPLAEDAVIEAAVMPLIRAKIDELAAGLAQSHAHMITPSGADGEPVWDLEQGKKDARIALLSSLVFWLDAEFDAGHGVALIIT